MTEKSFETTVSAGDMTGRVRIHTHPTLTIRPSSVVQAPVEKMSDVSKEKDDAAD